MPDQHPHPPHIERATRGQRTAWVVLELVIVGFALWTVKGFVPAVAWAGIFAIAIWPFFRRVCARTPRHARVLVPLLFTLGISLLFLVPFALALLVLAREVHAVVQLIIQAQHEGLPVPDWANHVPLLGSRVAEWWRDNLSDPDVAADLLGRFNRGAALGVGRSVGLDVLHRAAAFFFAMLALFFIFRDGEAITEQTVRVVTRVFGVSAARVAGLVVTSVHATVDGLVLVGLGEGAVMGVVYAFTDLPNPAIFGAATAVAAMIPFGAALVVAVAVAVLVAHGGIAAAIIVTVAACIVVAVADHAVRPALIGGATKLPFLAVLFGIIGGVEAWGLLGLFLGPALLSALVMLWREWASPSFEHPPE